MSSIRFTNATVWHGEGTESSEITVRNGVIARDDAPVDEEFDCDGGFIMPAFADGHAHPVFGGLEQQFAAVRGCSSIDEIADAVRNWAAAHPDAEWIRGEGFDPSLAPAGEFHAQWLDVAIPDRPVALRAMDYHTFWVNSEALRRVGYTNGVTQPIDGEIVLLADGSPMGTLREWGAWGPVQAAFGPLAQTDAIAALSYASRQYAAAGLTYVQDAWVEPELVHAWLSALDAGVLDIDANLALWCSPSTWREQLMSFETSRQLIDAQGRGRISATAVKFFADGVIEAGTGALLQPYCDCPHSYGMPNWERDELALAVTAIDALGFDAHIHAIGDAAIRNALDAMESAIRANPARVRHFVIAHTQLVDPVDIPRFQRLGVTANFEPLWACMDDDQRVLTRPRLGDERADRQYQIATMLHTGASVSFGSDWPVTNFAPLLGISTAITRQATASGAAWIPDERISIEAALSAYTLGVARQVGRADAGQIAPGYRGDVVWLANDPRDVEPFAIRDVPVMGTWRAGNRVH